MNSKATKRFNWSKPVVKPAKPQKGAIERRLDNLTPAKPAKSKIKDEYDALIKKRRGQ